MSPQTLRAAYDELAAEPGSLVMLSRLRARLGDVPREELDRVLLDLEGKRIIHLEPESNQKVLTQADRDAALRLGPQDVHAVKFLPGQQSTASPAERHVRQVRAAYDEMAAGPGEWVSIADIRARFPNMSREDMDALLRDLEQRPDVNIVPQSNVRALSERTRSAAVRIGGQEKHFIAMGIE